MNLKFYCFIFLPYEKTNVRIETKLIKKSNKRSYRDIFLCKNVRLFINHNCFKHHWSFSVPCLSKKKSFLCMQKTAIISQRCCYIPDTHVQRQITPLSNFLKLDTHFSSRSIGVAYKRSFLKNLTILICNWHVIIFKHIGFYSVKLLIFEKLLLKFINCIKSHVKVTAKKKNLSKWNTYQHMTKSVQ